MSQKAKRSVDADSPAVQVAGFIAKFDPEVAKMTRAARSIVRKRFPTAIELVYDNYNALAIGYSPTERTSDVIFSLAVYPRWVSLYFLHGRSLADPRKLLQGSGTQGGFIKLESIETLDDPAVKALIQAALKHSKVSFATKGRGYTIVKSISEKQRPRRARN